MTEQPTDETEQDNREHPALAGLSKTETVRVEVDGEYRVGEIDDVRQHTEGEIVSHAVTFIEDGYRGSVWDVEADYDPREGWCSLTGHKRVYNDAETKFETWEDITVEQVDLGIEPGRLDPGVTVEHLDGDHYRVVIPPWEREYGSKALAYNLDSRSNVCERVEPSEVIRRVA